MPILGTGMVPSGALGTELTYVTRRAFIKKLVVQLYQASVVFNLLLRNMQRAKGGVSQLTQPVQLTPATAASYIDFSGSFAQPQDLTSIINAEANLAVAAVPIPFFGLESLVQASEVVIPRLKVKMADAKQQLVQLLSNSLFTTGVPPALNLVGFFQAYDDGTNVTTYANINRTTNPAWKGTLTTSGGAILTRSAFIVQLLKATKRAGGEAPDIIIMSLGDWTTLMQDFMSVEQFNTMPGTRYGADVPVNAGFRALMLGDTPVVPDLYCPVGTAFFINTKYFALYLSEDAPFSFSGFYSAIPNNQIANQGVVIAALQTLCTKPVSGLQVTGITGGATL